MKINSSKPDTGVSVKEIIAFADRLNIEGYTLLESLGRGGFGSVYKSRQKSTGQLVAIKFLTLANIPFEQRETRKERFKRETQLCAALVHPHIVKLLDKGSLSEDHLYAVFEYIPGTTLKELLTEKKVVPAGEAGEFMAQVLDGLACAHGQGIVHRDLKPQNIMVTTTGARPCVKILDFGIGTFIPDARKTDYFSLTGSRETIGTPSYSAPEQLRGEPPTIKSDLYAWGLVLLECLTGQPVMRGETMAEIFHKQLSPIEILLPPAISGHELGKLLRRVLKKKPHERAGDAAQLYKEFIKINLNTLVGDLNTPVVFPYESNGEPTDVNVSFWAGTQSEQRQITVLCCNLSVKTIDDREPEFEIEETIQRDQLSVCNDIVLRYGGYIAGIMGNSMMIYFGYPHKNDNEARLAARTALEMAGEVRRRNSLLKTQHKIKLDLRIGIHTGIVLVRESEVPTGIVPNIALRLEGLASAEKILISRTTMELLKQYAEFEEASPSSITIHNKTLRTYFLIGEKKTEILSSLEPGNIGRPMIGRESEFEQIQDLWQEVKKNGKKSILISGEAGIGKSRLAYETHRSMMKEGIISRDVRCLPEHANNALYPILEMLKIHLEIKTIENPVMAVNRLEKELRECGCEVELAVPVLCSWMSLPLPEHMTPLQHSPDRQKQILFDVLEKILFSFSKEDPCVLFVEDLHWIDPTTLELLDRIIKKEVKSGILIIMTARPEFVNPWDAGTVHTLKVEGLPEPAVKSLIKNIAGDTQIDDHAVATLITRSDGIPLYIEELTYMLLDKQSPEENKGIISPEGKADSESIPVTLRDLLDARLNRMGSAKETLQIAAAIGREFDYNLLISTACKDEGTIQTDLNTLLSANLIFRQLHTKGELYLFKHALIRDAAYDSMLSSVKKETHRRIAETYESTFPNFVMENPSEIARHYGCACLYEKAVQYETEAAKITIQRSLNDDTIVHSQRVLRWADHLPEDKRQEGELTINMYLTQALMGKYGWADERVKERADRSLFLLNKVKGSTETIPALWSLITYHHVAGNRQEVRDLTDELERIAEKSDDPGFKVATDTLMGVRYQADGEHLKSAGVLERVLKAYDPERDREHGITFGLDTRAWSEASLGVVKWFVGYSEKCVTDYGENAIAWARSINHIPSLCISLLYRGLTHYHMGNREPAEKVMAELLQVADKYGLPAYSGYGSIVYYWAKCEPEIIKNILNTLKQLGCRLAISMYISMLADAQAVKGDIDEAVKTIDDCLEYARENEAAYFTEIYRQRALYELQRFPKGNELIHSCLLKAAETGRKQGAFRYEAESLADLSRLFGITEEQEKRLSEIRAQYPEIRLLETHGV